MDFYAQGLKLSAAGEHARAIEAFERALVANPSDGRVLFALGNTARALGMGLAAENFFRQVLLLEPRRIEALVNLASLLRQLDRHGEAEALLRPALEQNRADADLLLALGNTRREQGALDDALSLYREALACRPGFLAALVNLADMLAEGGNEDEALALYDQALKAGASAATAQARLNRAVLHLARGNFKDGWRDYAARIQVPGKVPQADHGLKRWSGENLKKTRLLVTAEQGVGDHLMFASVLPSLIARAEAEGGKIILECEKRLTSLFARSFPSVICHDWDLEQRHDGARSHFGWLKKIGGANAFIEMGSLPRYLRKSREDFPAPHRYLVPDAAEAQSWRAAFAGLPRPLTGICWRSGLSGGARSLAYAPLELWAAFIHDLKGSVVVVQYGAQDEEIAALEALSGRKLMVPQGIDQKQELDRATALISVLDCVVSSPTAVSWLAAGQGLATLKLQHALSWTTFGSDREVFGPSAKLLLAKTPDAWPKAFAKAKAEIDAL